VSEGCWFLNPRSGSCGWSYGEWGLVVVRLDGGWLRHWWWCCWGLGGLWLCYGLFGVWGWLAGDVGGFLDVVSWFWGVAFGVVVVGIGGCGGWCV